MAIYFPPLLAPFGMAAEAALSERWLAWLAAALGSDASPAAPPPNEADWEAAWPALYRHGLLPLLHSRLRNSPTWDALALARREQMEAAYYHNVVRSYLLEEELGRIATALAERGIPLLLLKGLAAAQVVYDHLAQRLINDLDLLVRPADVEQAAAALEALDYRAVGLTWLTRWQRRYRAELPLVCVHPQRAGLLVELHWSLVESPFHVARMDAESLWHSAQPARYPPAAQLPEPAILLVHGAAHLALHHSRALRLIWLVDLDRLARHPSLDWDVALQTAEAWHLGRALHEALGAAARWLGTPLPVGVGERLAALAEDPIGDATWGLGDEQPGRWWRRARVTWPLLSPSERLSYGAWLALRTVAHPIEALRRPKPPCST